MPDTHRPDEQPVEAALDAAAEKPTPAPVTMTPDQVKRISKATVEQLSKQLAKHHDHTNVLGPNFLRAIERELAARKATAAVEARQSPIKHFEITKGGLISKDGFVNTVKVGAVYLEADLPNLDASGIEYKPCKLKTVEDQMGHRTTVPV